MSSKRLLASAGIDQKSARIAASMAFVLASISSQIAFFSSKLKDCGEPRQTSALKYANSCSCAKVSHCSFVIIVIV